MKTSFTAFSLILAAGFPGSLLAEFAGVSLPAALEPGTTFGVAVAVLTLLTAFSDYTRHPSALVAGAAGATRDSALASATRTDAATEERRLAA
ncbi:MAG: hypothetical protein NTV51_07490 [Verrucomicrobia bacterium]|nr:hypothetical protein [Verrucomicrobiota bacterium]